MVTHAAISGLIIHRSGAEYAGTASWLDARRIEQFAGLAESEWNDDVETFYVVTAASLVEPPIPYSQLTLA